MSSLWTPEGEHRVRPPGDDRTATETASAPTEEFGPEAFDPEDLGPEERAEMAQRLDELRHQLLGTPADVVVANHAYGLFELAAIHLSQQPPRLDQARLAIDAMAALVEGLPNRLGEAERALNDALAQIRLAFVQISGTGDTTGDGGGPVDETDGGPEPAAPSPDAEP